jgi:hypothetical protein
LLHHNRVWIATALLTAPLLLLLPLPLPPCRPLFRTNNH